MATGRLNGRWPHLQRIPNARPGLEGSSPAKPAITGGTPGVRNSFEQINAIFPHPTDAAMSRFRFKEFIRWATNGITTVRNRNRCGKQG
ncbi:hypothetical protein GCM10027299_13280 [Larkinella ripae]